MCNESLCKVSQSAVMGPLVGHPAVLYGPYVGVLTSVEKEGGDRGPREESGGVDRNERKRGG